MYYFYEEYISNMLLSVYNLVKEFIEFIGNIYIVERLQEMCLNNWIVTLKIGLNMEHEYLNE